MRRKDFLFLVLLTTGALFVHGYHPWAEDASLYLPGVEKLLNPQLFPLNAQFFESHAHLTFFPEMIAASVRISHLPLPYALFIWHLASVFLFLFAGLELAGKCFPRRRSRYAGVALVAALLTLPVAGTALYIMDQYVNPRNLTAFVGVLAVAKLLDRKFVSAAGLLLFGAVIHPLMSVFAVFLCLLLFSREKLELRRAVVVCLLPFGFLDPASPAYHQAAVDHSYFYPMQWQWYEWLGAIGPIVILWWFSRIAQRRQMRNLELVSRTLIFYQTIFIIAALAISVPPRFESLARLQPMRSLHLVYVVLALFSGGLLGEFLLKGHWWRWIALFLPLCAGMFYAQRALFPASAHIEWPGSKPRNPWIQAFEWARNNTLPDAIFALDPSYMNLPGEDENGFPAIAQRRALADGNTDSGAVAMFPPLAEEWSAQMLAENGWQNFQLEDFRRLQARYGVTWVILQQPAMSGLQCPYQNRVVRVCRVY